MDTERIMGRVRRLLAIANDPAASDNEQRIALMESPLTDEELLLLDGWSPTPTALWRLKARGSID